MSGTENHEGGERKGSGRARLLVGASFVALAVGLGGYVAVTKHGEAVVGALEGVGAPAEAVQAVKGWAGIDEAAEQEAEAVVPMAETPSAPEEAPPPAEVSGDATSSGGASSPIDMFRKAADEAAAPDGPALSEPTSEEEAEGKVYDRDDVEEMQSRVRDETMQDMAEKRADPNALPWEGYRVDKPKTVHEVARERAEAASALADTEIGSDPAAAVPVAGEAGATLADLLAGRSASPWKKGALWEVEIEGAEVARRILAAPTAFEVEDTRLLKHLPPRTVPQIFRTSAETGNNVVTGHLALPKAGTYRFDLHMKMGQEDFDKRGGPRCDVRLDVGDATVIYAQRMQVGIANAAVREGLRFDVPEGKEGLHPYTLEYSCYGFVPVAGYNIDGSYGGPVLPGVADGSTEFEDREVEKMAEYWKAAYQSGVERPVNISLRLMEPDAIAPRPLGDGDLFLRSDIEADFAEPLKVSLKPGIYAESFQGRVVDEKWDIRSNPDLSGHVPAVQETLPAGKLPFFDRSGLMSVRVYRGVLAVRRDGFHSMAITLESGAAPNERDMRHLPEHGLSGTRRCVTALRLDRGWGMSFPSPNDPSSNLLLAPWHEGKPGREMEPMRMELAKGLHPFALYVGCRSGMDGAESAAGLVRVDADWRVDPKEPQLYASLWMKHDDEPQMRLLGEGDLYRDDDFALPVPEVEVIDLPDEPVKGAPMGVLSFDDFDDAPNPKRGENGRPSDLGGGPDGLQLEFNDRRD